MEAAIMSDSELVERFERGETPGEEFHHADHLRLAYAYLGEYPTLVALGKFSEALKRFANARGKTRLYHETITCAYFFLIRERMAQSENNHWEEFVRQNPDLLVWKDGVLSRYYHNATLKCELARRIFILPDKSIEK
jgi:hypothetical protein